MRKLDVYARIRERCSDSFVEHVTACVCSLKRDARVEILFKIVVVKISTQSNGNSAIGFPIVQTVVKDSWSFVPSTIRVMSRVLWLETSEIDGNPRT